MKKTISLLLVLVMILCASAGIFAAETADFSDVASDAWYAEAVGFVKDQGLMVGTSDDKFSPDRNFTRAQLAMVLYRIAGEPAVSGEDSFTDTNAGEWYSDAILWAEQKGVVEGIGHGLYGTNRPVTQEQMATMLWRMEGGPDAPEAADASGYAAKPVGWAREKGIAPNTGSYSFAPKENASRAQTAAILMAYLKYKGEAEQKLTLTVACKEIDVAWADNSSVDALRELLKKGDITLDMSDFGGFEKGAPLPESLPQNNEQMDTNAGDIILYQGKQFVIYYDKNSWSLTPLGKIQGMSKAEIKALLGAGNVSAVLSLTGSDKGAKEEPKGRILVAYFSATGNTKPLAEYAAEILGADLYEIVPEQPYTVDDLRYYTDCRADREQRDPNARPSIGSEPVEMEKYDTILIGHPIWHGQAPKIIYSFLESYDLSGKTLVSFCTSGSSPLGSSAENLKKIVPSSAKWLESRRFSAGTSRASIENWLKDIGLD